ncbi:hypothetical protein WIS52_23250 [Pseudonocardia nematodicida]|uniref:Uncharacterized protein n=1 Tax=Pseudonocardia nematodicida TaxID=1206997 RepID=A0ABV1KJ91_9PSEU
MRVLFDGGTFAHYGQFYLGTGPDPGVGWERNDCFAGQRNGLCGAGEPGGLFLMAGLHTGDVPVTVECHDDEPGLPDVGDAEDVVEVPFLLTRGPAALFGWGDEGRSELDLPPDAYRVRYCAAGMDAARAADTRRSDEAILDRYRLQFWPAPAEADRVVRVGSDSARYWHDYAIGLPAPARSPTERARDRARDPELARERAMYLNLLWAGQRPPGPLGTVELARTVVLLDRKLADALVELPPDRQRGLAHWTARRAVTDADLDRIDWIAEACGWLGVQPLPAELLDDSRALTRLYAVPGAPRRVVTSSDEHRAPLLQQAMALPAIAAADHPDPAVALLETVHHAATAAGDPGYQELFADLRRAMTG